MLTIKIEGKEYTLIERKDLEQLTAALKKRKDITTMDLFEAFLKSNE